MERGNTKHNPRLDDAMEHEVREVLHSGSRGEGRDPEPVVGDDQELAAGILPGGAPAGMTPEEVEQRSELGRYIPLSALPGNRDELVVAAHVLLAPDHVLDKLAMLPSDGTRYRTVAQIWAALGHPNETKRN
jgi:hypothetical protein